MIVFAIAIIENDTIVGHMPRNTSRLKYFHRAISNSPPCVERKNLNGYTGLRGYLFSRFTKYPRNPQKFFILKNNSPYST